MSINVKWDITYRCNLNCKHCINGKMLGDIEDELSLEDIGKVLNNLKDAGVGYIHLLGGEPTARSDFQEILAEFEKRNINFGFNTNGLKLSFENVREYIIKNKNVKNIVFSIEGPSADINDAIRGKKVFDITTRNLKDMIRMKQKFFREDLVITVNTVVSKINKEYIKDMIYFCNELGVDEIVLLQFIPEGNAEKLDAVLNSEDILILIREIAECYDKLGNKIKITPKFLTPLAEKYANCVLKMNFPKLTTMCGAGENYFYINNRGELYPCDRYVNRIKLLNKIEEINLKDNDFWRVANKDGYEEIFMKIENVDSYKKCNPCNKCEYIKKNCFPCAAQGVCDSEGNIKDCIKLMEEINNV